jgi:hypothetical protein
MLASSPCPAPRLQDFVIVYTKTDQSTNKLVSKHTHVKSESGQVCCLKMHMCISCNKCVCLHLYVSRYMCVFLSINGCVEEGGVLMSVHGGSVDVLHMYTCLCFAPLHGVHHAHLKMNSVIILYLLY